MKMKLGIFVLLNLSFTLVIAQSTLTPEVSKYENCIADFVNGLLNCKDSNELLKQIHIYPLNSTSNEISLRLNPTLSRTFFTEFIHKIQNKCTCDLSVNRCGCAAPLGRTIIVSVSVTPPTPPSSTTTPLPSTTTTTTTTSTTSTAKAPETPTSPSTPIDKYNECIADFTKGFVYCVNAQGLINETHISPINSTRMGEILKLNPTLPESFIKTYVLNYQNECSCDLTIRQCTCAAPLGRKAIIPITVLDSNEGSTTEATSFSSSDYFAQRISPTTEASTTTRRKIHIGSVGRYENCTADFIEAIYSCIEYYPEYDSDRYTRTIVTSVLRLNANFEKNLKLNRGVSRVFLHQFLEENKPKCACDFYANECSCATPLNRTIKVLI